MSTFDDDERSVSSNRPIDLYTLTSPTATYRLTSHVVDVQYGGFTFTALTMSRGNLQIGQNLTGREFVVYLPITHPIVQRFAASGIPERELLVKLQRLQERSGQAQQQWLGFAQGMSIDGHVALLRVPSITDDALKVKLPTVRAQRLCNHVLYDRQCQVDRNAFKVDTTISSMSGITLVLADIGGHPDHWADPAGELVHTATGERRSVLRQIGTTLTLNVPFVGAVPGELVTVFAACSHSLQTCKAKFGNVINFGGLPHMNTAINPWAAKGLGIIVQE